MKFSFKLTRNKGVYYTKWKTKKHARQKIWWLTFTTQYFNLKQFWLIVTLLRKKLLLIIWKAKTQPSTAQWTLPQAEQLYGLSPVCLILCLTNFRCILNDFPHSSQVNTLSAVWVFLCSFKLLKLLKPRKIWQALRLKWFLTFQSKSLRQKLWLLHTSATDITQVRFFSRMNNYMTLNITRSSKSVRQHRNPISVFIKPLLP